MGDVIAVHPLLPTLPLPKSPTSVSAILMHCCVVMPPLFTWLKFPPSMCLVVIDALPQGEGGGWCWQRQLGGETAQQPPFIP